jgi:hypothetical protein
MKTQKIYLLLSVIFIFTIFYNSNSQQIEFKYDSGNYLGNSYVSTKAWWEESAYLQPDGPCKVQKIKIYYAGDKPAIDTIHIVGFPIAGNLYPTHYAWVNNTLIDPIIYNYDGTPGWKEFDVSGTGLKSDGFDKIVIQHYVKPDGPWFGYDDGRPNSRNLSWMTDPWTPNPNFYNIPGTMYAYPPGNYMIRLIIEYNYPDGNTSLPPPAPTLVDVTDEVGLSGGGYVSVVDWNNDGWDDIAIGGNFFQNNKDGTFKNVTAQFNISAGATAWGDFDNDGNVDVYGINIGAQDFVHYMVIDHDVVYKNNGNGTFSLMNNKTLFKLPYPNPSDDFSVIPSFSNDSMFNPYYTCTPLWLDYNGDGWLDLFIANRRMEGGSTEIWCPDQLWRNNKDGSFSNVRTISGIAAGEPRAYWPGQGYYDCYGATACDYNKDNKMDIFVANYRLIKDNLYKNNGDSTFTEVGAYTGTQGVPTTDPGSFGHGMGCQWADFNNDGLPDLCVGNLAHTDWRAQFSNSSLIFRNDGPPDYKFTEVHQKMGLKFHEGNAGVCWADLNLDGYIDLWHGIYSGGMNWVYLNQGPPDYKLLDITWLSGAYSMSAWTAVYIDFDHDGDLDLIINGRLFRNDMKREGNWIAFRLSGKPDENVSTEAFGSKVTVYSGSKLFYRELGGSAAGSLCTQNSNELHFGLGQITNIDSVVINYPNGQKNVLTNLAVNARYRVLYKANATLNGIAAPGLNEPKNFATQVPANTILSWFLSGGATSYTVLISDKKDFSNIISATNNNSSTSFTATNLEAHKTYYWKVKAFSSQDSSNWSTSWHFTVGIPSYSFNLISPKNDSINISTKPTLNWHVMTFSDNIYDSLIKYQLQVSTSNSFSNAIDTIFSRRDTLYSFISALTPAIKYYWHVRPIIEGQSQVWSETWNFTTMPLPDAPVLKAPALGETNVNVKPTFTWEASAFANLYFLQVAKDEQFNNIYYELPDITSTTRKIFKNFDGGTKYFWHIRGSNDGGRDLV